MLIYLADLAHTHSTKNESLMIPLNIGYLKAFAMEQHKDKLNIKLFKDPNKLLKSLHDENPDLVGLSNYGWNADLNLKIGKYIKFKSQILSNLEWQMLLKAQHKMSIRRTIKLNYYPLLVKQFWGFFRKEILNIFISQQSCS